MTAPPTRPAGLERQGRRIRSRQHGFSLLELTVVIGIIMLLLTLSVVGYRYLEASAARNRTRTVLHDLEAMTAELDRTGGMIRLVAPSGALYTTTQTLSSPGNATLGGGNQVGISNSYSTPALGILALVPANQQALTQLPVKSLVPGTLRLYNNIQVSAVADGWGNPIIFVPPGGLTNVQLGAKANSSGSITYSNTVTITSPDHRPFWASAGQDGNFTTGDDNVYSFEK